MRGVTPIDRIRLAPVRDPPIDRRVGTTKPTGDLRSAETPGFFCCFQALLERWRAHAFGTIFMPIDSSILTSSGLGAAPALMPN